MGSERGFQAPHDVLLKRIGRRENRRKHASNVQATKITIPAITIGLRRNLAAGSRHSASWISNSGVKEIVEDVDDKIHSHVDEGDQHTHAHDSREVLRRGRAKHIAPDARPREDRFGQHGARQQRSIR